MGRKVEGIGVPALERRLSGFGDDNTNFSRNPLWETFIISRRGLRRVGCRGWTPRRSASCCSYM